MQMVAARTFLENRPTERLAKFASTLSYDAIDPKVRHAARRHVLDTVGAILAGARQRATRVVEEVLADSVGSGDVPAAGLRRRFDALSAAYLMGTAAHGLELDDGYRKGSVHPGCVVVPGLLAAAHGNSCSGRDFLAAVVVGYEIAARIARSMHPRSRRRGFHNTSVAGPLAVAAAVGRMRGLDATRIAHAMGLAASAAGGLFAFLAGGGEVKRTHPGRAAREGLFSALLAERGLTGPTGVIEIEDGMLQAFAGEADLAALVGGLGENGPDDFAIADCYLKPFAACRHLHPGIDGLLQIRGRTDIDPEAVERIEVGTYAIAVDHGETGWHDMLSAQMSYPFVLATALVRGAVDLEHFTDEARAEADVTRHCSKVRVELDPECEAAYPKERGAWLRLVLRNDERHEIRVREPYGAPANPMSDEAVLRKYRGLASPVLGEERAVGAEALLWRLDELADMTEVTQGLAAV